MKTGHRAIQLHTYGPRPSTCVNLYVCMPSGSVLSVPGVCLPSGCICACLACPPSVRAKCVHCGERAAGHGGELRIMLGNPPIATLVCQLCVHWFSQRRWCHDQLMWLWPIMSNNLLQTHTHTHLIRLSRYVSPLPGNFPFLRRATEVWTLTWRLHLFCLKTHQQKLLDKNICEQGHDYNLRSCGCVHDFASFYH